MTKLSRRQTVVSMLAAGAGIAAPATRAFSTADSAARLSFLLVNDFYEIGGDKKDRRGGMARFAAAVKVERERARAANRRLFCIHAGDTLSPSVLSSFDQGKHMVDLFNDVRLDYFVPGNHEFDFGKEIYFKRMGEARFPILAANLRDATGLELPGHRDQDTIEADGIKLAFIGAAFEQTASVSSPDDLQFLKTEDAVIENADRARNAGADFVIAIVHADTTTGAALMSTHLVDLILSGHNHDLHIDFDGRTAFVESDYDANYVTVVDIDVARTRDEASRSFPWWPDFRVLDTAKIDPDPLMRTKVDDYEAALDKELNVEIARLDSPLDSRTDCVRSRECEIGNLIADALRKKAAADVAIINGGAIRHGQYYRAWTTLTKRDIRNTLPHNDKTVQTQVKGGDILAALENGFSELPNSSGRFPQVSGLSIVADRAAPPRARVKTVMVNGEALDKARDYKLATNDFLARGKDGYGMLAGKSLVSPDSGTRLVALDVMDYVEGLKHIDAKVEGRIAFR